MDKLSRPMQDLIRNYNAGAVASIDADGRPAVSPKATFVIVDERCIAFGDIRSPETVANLRERPAVEVCFIDVLARLAVRVRGQAEVVDKESARGQALMPHFAELWAPYLDAMRHFVSISIERAARVETNFDKLSKIAALQENSA